MSYIGIIYRITNLTSSKSYIGRTTKGINTRWLAHKCMGRSTKCKTPLYRDMRRYGIENFVIEQIARTKSWKKLRSLEMFYIKKFNTLYPLGYNLKFGDGFGSAHYSTRCKISRSLKKRAILTRRNNEY